METKPRSVQSTPSNELRSLSALIKFTALAAMLAIFSDAAIGHALIWGNDPQWTYWITDTLLMATVFGLGTAWFGIGVVRGAIITVVHVTLLTAYYWTLSPIGLPSQPEWLDLEHTWTTGLPVHFGVYYLGYVLALWLWRRRARPVPHQARSISVAGVVTLAIAAATSVVVIVGLLQTWTTGVFPGITWFVVRIAVATPFTLGWWTLAGNDRIASAIGGTMLGFLLTTYGHFLAPVGLPNSTLRLFEEPPPSAVVHWLSYRQEFFVILPITVGVAILVYFVAACFHRGQRVKSFHLNRAAAIWASGAILGLASLGVAVASYGGSAPNRATVVSAGSSSIESGTPYQGELISTHAVLRMIVENRNTHRTPLPPHDLVRINATVHSLDGTIYDIDAAEPMVADPQGRFTTWAGVGFNVWHHGHSGIGVSQIPPARSNVAVFAMGDIRANNTLIATGVPLHVMTTDRDGGRLELHVGDTTFPVQGIPAGHLRVLWRDYEGGYSQSAVYVRYIWGSGILLVLLGFAVTAAHNQARKIGMQTRQS